MLDIKKIAENSELVKQAMKNRNNACNINEILELESWRKEIIKVVERQRALRNLVSEEIAYLKKKNEDADSKIAQMKDVGEEIKRLDAELEKTESSIREKLLSLPNIPDISVPVGKDETENRIMRSNGKQPRFDFEPKPHWELGESLGIIDPAAAAKITGARFTLYRGLGARLERALINFMLDTHTENGYTEVFPPFMVNRDSMYGTGQLPKFEEDAFAVSGTDYFLVPTAEVPVTNTLRKEVLELSSLPVKYCAYTACFRKEAGSAGRDTRGLIRLHQFNKVELIKFARQDNSFVELETMTADAEGILKKLGLPYRVVALCTGDLGFASSKTYDLEVWMPSYDKYMEISSCSNCTDFQSRRMNTKYRLPDGQTAFVHTLNGSGLAIGRTVAAILENYQTKDGRIIVPDVLIPYMKTKIIG